MTAIPGDLIQRQPDGSYVVYPLSAAGGYMGPLMGQYAGYTDDLAVQQAINALGGPGVVRLAPGTFTFANTVTATQSGVTIEGAGFRATTVAYTGSSDCFHIYSPTATLNHGGGIRRLTIDGINAGNGAVGIHMSDIYAFEFDVEVINFERNSNIGVYLDNNLGFSEEMHGYLLVSNCMQCVVFDVTGTGTRAFGYEELTIHLTQVFKQGVVLQNGAQFYDSRMTIRAGCEASSTALATGDAVLAIIGATGGGSSSQITGSRLDITAESGSGTYPLQSIYFDTSNNCRIQGCEGVMDFSQGTAFASSNRNKSNFVFTGPVYGESTLGATQFSLTNAQGALASNGTIEPQGSVVSVDPAAAVTGIILGTGTYDGQIVWVVNLSANSITFAASGSNVADGSSDVIAATTSRGYVWNAAQALWYRMG